MSFYDKYTIILCSTAAIAYFITGYYDTTGGGAIPDKVVAPKAELGGAEK